MAERPPAHRSFRIDLDDERAHAVCACGWRSESALNAGMAGALWDVHLSDVSRLAQVSPNVPDSRT